MAKRSSRRSTKARRTLHFVTNRAPEKRGRKVTGFGAGFNDGGAEDLRFGKLTVEVPRSRLEALDVDVDADDPTDAAAEVFDTALKSPSIQLYRESILKSARTEFDEGAKVVYGSVALFEALRKVMTGGRDVVVYVHGYNTDFRGAAKGALVLQERLAARDVRLDGPRKAPAVVLFTWPSDGRVTPWVSYRSDRLEAAPSGYALGRALLKMRDFLRTIPREEMCGSGIHLYCHSMGNFVLQNAVERVAMHSPGQRMPRLLDQVFMVAPDVDDTVFRDGEPLAQLPDLCDGVHVYFNESDNALRVSDATKANPERLGARGVSHPGELHQKVEQIDCHGFAHAVDRLVGHGYHLSREVFQDARVWIDGRMDPPGLRRPGPRRNTWRL